MKKKRTSKGPSIKRRDCPACKGAGFLGHVRCVNCGGKGVIATVSDPDASEKQLRLPGQ